MLLTRRSLALALTRATAVDARKTIVAGAVGIVGDALESLKDRGVEVGAGDQPRFVGNLMTVLCSEKSPVPTIDM